MGRHVLLKADGYVGIVGLEVTNVDVALPGPLKVTLVEGYEELCDLGRAVVLPVTPKGCELFTRQGFPDEEVVRRERDQRVERELVGPRLRRLQGQVWREPRQQAGLP